MHKFNRLHGRNSLFLRVIAILIAIPGLGLSLTAQAAETESFIVSSAAPGADSITDAIHALGGTITQRYENIGAIAVSLPADKRMALKAIPGVEAVYKDSFVAAPRPIEMATVDASEIQSVISGEALAEALADLPDDYLFNANLTGASVLHGNGITGAGVVTVVIDSGTTNNAALVPAIAGRVIGGENFVPGVGEPSATSSLNGNHGTWVGTTMAANTAFCFSNFGTIVNSLATHAPGSVILNFPPCGPNASLVPMIGTAPDAQIYAMKTFAAAGGGAPESRIIAAMDRAITIRRNFNNGMPSVPVSGTGTENDPFVFDSLPIEIVNMSLGGPTLFAGRDLEDSLTQAMLDVGITLIASAGNEGHASMTGGSPGTGIGSLTSGAASLVPNERVLRDLQFGLGFGSLYRPANHHQMATFSSRGPTADGRLDPENSASGFAVFAQGASGGLSVVSGTSFSAPNTAGGAVLLRQAEPNASATAIRDALVDSSNPFIIQGAADIDQGRGFVDFP
ncbi:MAG: S8 family serine peptidase, partial [Gammaproteobacteria bacterium]|nr:S8 family serine peptidase [Gammaproteobacteria bacterium]